MGLKLRLLFRAYKYKILFANLVGMSVVKSRYGVRLAMNYGDATFKSYVLGSYGNFYWDRLTKINSEFLFINIGANQGLYTICASRNPNNFMSYAFEPVSDTFNLLRKNIELNQLTSKCTLVNKAISDKCAITEISVKSNHSGAASLAQQNELYQDANNKIRVETIDGIKLETLVEQKNLPIVVKIDVEGWELTVIKQLMDIPSVEKISEVFYEVDEKWVNPKEIEDALSSVGFKSFEKIGTGSHYDVLAKR